MGLPVIARIFVAILSILRVGLAIAIIIITAEQLYHIKFWISYEGNAYAYRAQCLMAGDVRGQDVCEYAYAVCGLSMLLSLLTSILLCVTCDLCGAGTWLEFVVEGFQTAWWIIAGIVISKKVRDSNDVVLEGGHGMPKEEWRNAVAVMTWVAALLSFLIALFYLAEAIKVIAKCCCKGKDDSSHGGEHHHKEKKHGKDKDEARAVDYGTPQPAQPPQQQTVGGGDQAVRANAV